MNRRGRIAGIDARARATDIKILKLEDLRSIKKHIILVEPPPEQER
jgi:hypothetical protein